MYKRGFTLIELLVVIAIIGMLSSVVLASLSSARSKARDAIRSEDIYQIKTALELYYHDNGRYPPSGGALTPNNAWNNSTDSSWDTLQTALAPYIKKLPKDPLENNVATEWITTGGQHYYYFGWNDYEGCAGGQYYWLLYRLENAKGPDYGVKMCDGTTLRQYGGSGANTNVKTAGSAIK